jgi:hypothetical protein
MIFSIGRVFSTSKCRRCAIESATSRSWRHFLGVADRSGKYTAGAISDQALAALCAHRLARQGARTAERRGGYYRTKSRPRHRQYHDRRFTKFSFIVRLKEQKRILDIRHSGEVFADWRDDAAVQLNCS